MPYRFAVVGIDAVSRCAGSRARFDRSTRGRKYCCRSSRYRRWLGCGVSPRRSGADPGDYMKALRAQLGTRALKILVEPGRSIVANAGVLLTRVDLLKSTPSHHFAVVDAAMNDLIRPALYQAWQSIEPVREHDGRPGYLRCGGASVRTGDFRQSARIDY
ncbi:MAG: hypothetical protein R3E67_05200 [Pseudomonadales bacterium]